MRTLSLALLLALLPSLSAAEIVKCVTPDGRVHYGDRGLPGCVREQVEVEPAPEVDPHARERMERIRRLNESNAIDRERDARAAAEAERRAAERQTRCAYARDRLRRYRQAGVLYRPRPDGGRDVVGDAERQASIARAQAQVGEYCP